MDALNGVETLTANAFCELPEEELVRHPLRLPNRLNQLVRLKVN